MLKRYKNGIFDEIRRAGFNPEDFEAKDRKTAEHADVFGLRHIPSGLTFLSASTTMDPNQFHLRYAVFPSGAETAWWPPTPTSFELLVKRLRDWLTKHVQVFIEESTLPDLWEQMRQAQEQTQLAAPLSAGSNDTEKFTEEEKRQIRLCIKTFRLLVLEEFSPNQERLDVIDEKLDYVTEALDRLNRFDWRSVLMSIVLGIGINLTVDTAQGNRLWALLQTAFSSFQHLLLTGRAGAAL